MANVDWRVKRGHYSFAVGILAVIAAQLRSPAGALIGYALFAGLTALRFRTLGWKVNRAFIPLAIATGGTLLGLAVGPGPSALRIVTQSHAIALLAQVGMSLRAALSFAPIDPMSRRTALARDMLAKRRQLLLAIKEAKPHRETLHREIEALNALNADRAAYVAAHGYKPTPESKALSERLAAQVELVKRLGEESRGRTQVERAELEAAVAAWRNRNRRDAA